uniref:FYVE-type domain-containing protein n=1 Tax=Ditylenchus dipsaci TaxID=166011 RepID=A0A915DR05_9BILA
MLTIDSPTSTLPFATSSSAAQDDTTSTGGSCEMCSNYETNLTRLQDAERDLKEQLVAAQELATRYEKDLSGERIYRKELESKLTALSLEADNKIQQILDSNASYEERLELLVTKQESDLKFMQEDMESARIKCQSIESEILELNRRYQNLLGLNKQKANEMREQNIDLPQTVEDLELVALQLREELIETRAAYEHSVDELKEELTVARQHVLEMQMRLKEAEDLLDESSIGLQIQQQQEGSGDNESGQRSPNQVRYVDDTNGEIQRHRQIIADLEHQISSFQRDFRSQIDLSVNEYRQKCATLQRELDTSETVQKDFVQLSQSLQIQLEKIRQAEREVRWQFEGDIEKCNQCESIFDKTREEKKHCLHCGKIFCSKCLTNTIVSGPKHRPAEVCDVCHTLLNRLVDFQSNRM